VIGTGEEADAFGDGLDVLLPLALWAAPMMYDWDMTVPRKNDVAAANIADRDFV
jgi:hypothetical protein